MTIAAVILREYPKMSDAQRQIVAHGDGPLLVIAGPGSGKTFSLVLRAMNLLLLGKVMPRELVLCTFTEKAAFELRDRMSAAARKVSYTADLSELKVSTIHGLCNRLLTLHRHRTPLGNNYETLDELTQLLFIFEHFKEIVGEDASPPYLGKWSVLGQILAVEPDPPSRHRPGLAPALDAICAKAMAKQAQARFASMEELAAALTNYLRGAIVPAPSPARPPAARAPAPPRATAARQAAEIEPIPLAPLADLLDEAAHAPPRAIERERATAPPRRQPTLRARTIEPRRGPKDERVLLRPLGYAALVLVILGGITAAALWWPRKGSENDAVVAEASKADARDAENAGRPPVVEAITADTLAGPSVDMPPLGEPSTVGGIPDAHGGIPGAPVGDANGVSAGEAAPSAPAASEAAAPTDAGNELGETAPEPKRPGLLVTVKHDYAVTAVAVSADGSTLVTAAQAPSGVYSARLWDAADGAPRGAPLVHESAVTGVSLSPDGRHVVTEIRGTGEVGSRPFGSARKQTWFQPIARKTVLWGPAAERDQCTPMLTAIPGPIAFTTDGKKLLVVNARSVKAPIPGDRNASRSWYDPNSLRFEWHELPAIAAARRPKALEAVGIFGTDDRGIFSPDLECYAKVIYPLKQPPVLRFWDTHTGKLRGQPATGVGVNFDRKYAFRRDSRALAIFPQSADSKPTRRLVFFEVPTARLLKDIELSGPAYQMAFDPAGDLLAVCVGGVVELRDAETGVVRGPIVLIKGTVAAFSPDGRRLFVGKSGTAQLWDLDTLLAPADK